MAQTPPPALALAGQVLALDLQTPRTSQPSLPRPPRRHRRLRGHRGRHHPLRQRPRRLRVASQIQVLSWAGPSVVLQ